MRSPPPSFGALEPDELLRLRAGEHETLARQLAEAGRHALAGWVREQIWDFDGAEADYRSAERPVDVLRVTLESGSALALDRALRALDSASDEAVEQALALLRKRKRNMEVARLLAARSSAPESRAQALLKAGNRVGAALALAEAGRPRDALEALALDPEHGPPHVLSLAARLSWALGDAEGAARLAQRALRGETRDGPELAALLARALGSLGHDLAAQLVLQRHGARPSDDAVPGRYRVTGLLPTALAGSAYVGMDRLTLQEVEIHLLLADQPEPIDPQIAAAVDRFTHVAQAASAVGHPAIRPVLRIEPDAGLLVLARAEGPPLRQMIRPPGLSDAVPRARAVIAFLLEGLMAAHERGLVHGAVLPSVVVTDALGRPQLGPFGSHHLAGLTATRTGGLEELMVMTAPEVRRGAPPSPRSDLYAVGAMLHALLTGRLEAPTDDDPAVAPAERALVNALTATDPAERPDAAAVLAKLRTPVADMRDLARAPEASASRSTAEGTLVRLEVGVEVDAADSWSPELLDALCAATNPWLQPILDRTERTIVLARWPETARVLDDEVAGWRGLVPAAALELPAPLREAVDERLRPSSVVVTAAGTRMLALDDLLSR